MVLALILTSLFVLSRQAAQAGYASLLMITPSTFGMPGLTPERLEEFSEEEFLLTYAIRQPATTQAVNSRNSAVLIGTNHNYAGIMKYVLLDGGFFTKSAMDLKSKHVTLNETAAFQIFGSSRIAGNTLKVNGEIWIITGVIQDNDTDNLNLYAPAGVTGGRADSIMVLMDETYTEAYVINALKSIGVRDNAYGFIKLARLANAFDERFSVGWKASLSVAVLFFILVTGGKLMEDLRFYRGRRRELYFRELLAYYRKDFLKTMCGLLVLAGGITVMLALFLQILETCLTWQELMPITGELTAGDFGYKLLWLRDYYILSGVLFWICICLILLGLAFVLLRQLGKTGIIMEKNDVASLYGEAFVKE